MNQRMFNNARRLAMMAFRKALPPEAPVDDCGPSPAALDHAFLVGLDVYEKHRSTAGSLSLNAVTHLGKRS